MEVRYCKDFRHNYLIMCTPEEMSETYQCRMITGNKIRGLLGCQEKHINGELLLYYDISSLQSLKSVYESRAMSMKQLREFFLQLKMVWEGLEKYLLDEDCLVLLPEYIFVDLEADRYSFLFYPFAPEEHYFSSLLEFLMARTDREDNPAIETVYKMYELVEREQFALDEVLSWFDRDIAEEAAGSGTGDGEKEKEKDVEREGSQDSKEEGWERWEKEEREAQEERQKEKKERNKKTAGCCLAGAALLGGAQFYIYQAYYLSEEMWVYFTAACIGTAAVFLASACYLLLSQVKWRCPVSEISPAGKFFHGEKERTELPMQNTEFWEREDKERILGNTMFVPWVENCEHKLYGMGKGNKNHIDLAHLPLTVGKLAGSVDMVIGEQSVSRRHVKFERKENKIYMTDLNSTNGTFKNGLRLEPNTSEILEPGDEIRLGKLKFIYR